MIVKTLKKRKNKGMHILDVFPPVFLVYFLLHEDPLAGSHLED